MAIANDTERGKRIAELRRDARYSQAALAATVGVHENSVQNWERGRAIEWPNIVQLARVLNVTPEFIVAGGDKSTPATVSDRIELRLSKLEAAEATGALERRIGGGMRGGYEDIVKRVDDVLTEVSQGREDVAALAATVQELGLQVGALRRELAAQRGSDRAAQQPRTPRRSKNQGT